MKCIDEPFEFYGNYDTFKGSNLLIVFELCDSNKTVLEEGQQCLEEDEMQKKLEFSYLSIVENAE